MVDVILAYDFPAFIRDGEFLVYFASSIFVSTVCYFVAYYAVVKDGCVVLWVTVVVFLIVLWWIDVLVLVISLGGDLRVIVLCLISYSRRVRSIWSFVWISWSVILEWSIVVYWAVVCVRFSWVADWGIVRVVECVVPSILKLIVSSVLWCY